MKVTVLEYEEDPTVVTPNNGDPTSAAEGFSFSQLLSCEHTIDLNIIKNSDGNTNSNNYAVQTTSRRRTASSFSKSLVESPIRVVRQLFLPIGYPHSVDPTYLPYQLYDGLQGLCSYWRGVVSTKAVFQAAGVGDAKATAMSAALNWAVRDGTGMIGGLLYSYVASSYFDSHVKECRLFLADVVNDVALTLDMMAPYFGPIGLVYILSLSTIGKTMCGITAGATKGRITHHFARHNGNMADLTAKESTQETLVSLVGMIGGVYVAKMLEHSDAAWTWLMFGILTMLHVWANYKAVTLLKLTTLNPERTRVLFQTQVVGIMAQNVRRDIQTGVMVSSAESLSPQLVSAIQSLSAPEDIQESMSSSLWNLLFPTIRLSRPINFSSLRDCSLFMSDVPRDLPYIIGFGGGTTLYVWLTVGATMEDELRAYVHALLLQALMSGNGGLNDEFSCSLFQRYENTFFDVVGFPLVCIFNVFYVTLSPMSFCELHFTTSYSSVKQINNLFDSTIQSTITGDGVSVKTSTLKDGFPTKTTKVTLMKRLEYLGWDLQSRLYLGFPSRRLHVAVKDD